MRILGSSNILLDKFAAKMIQSTRIEDRRCARSRVGEVMKRAGKSGRLAVDGMAKVGYELGALLLFEYAGIAASAGEVRPRLHQNQRDQQGGGAGVQLRMIGTQARGAF